MFLTSMIGTTTESQKYAGNLIS